jgi:predicted secreted protein
MKKFLFFHLLLLVITNFAFAGDISKYEFMGFSKDLRYCAFETYGIQDGSGFPYSEIYIINVDKNAYQTKPYQYCNDEDTNIDKTRKVVLKMAVPFLKKYGIEKSQQGTLLFNKPKNLQSCNFKIKNKKCSLKLLERELDDPTTDFVIEKIFELQLIVDGKMTILQKDSKLPESRGCPYKYRLLSAYYHTNKIAVFVEYDDYGFEGPNVRQLLVTGIIDY